MKKLLAYLLIFSILVFHVFAADANIYESGDFNKNPEQMVILEERDMVRINWDGKDHQLHVRAVYPDKKKVDLTAFIEGSEVPFYTTINPKTSLQLDFNRDDIYDLKVSVFNIIEEDGKKFVALKLQKLENSPDIIITESIIETQDNKSFQIISKTSLYIVGLILFLLGLLIIWKKGFLSKHIKN